MSASQKIVEKEYEIKNQISKKKWKLLMFFILYYYKISLNKTL